MLGGEGRAGKTSTKNNLLGLGFNAESESTNGIAISKADMSDMVRAVVTVVTRASLRAHVLLVQTFSQKAQLNVVKDGVIQALPAARNQPAQTTPSQPKSHRQTATTPKQVVTSSSVLMTETGAGMLLGGDSLLCVCVLIRKRAYQPNEIESEVFVDSTMLSSTGSKFGISMR